MSKSNHRRTGNAGDEKNLHTGDSKSFLIDFSEKVSFLLQVLLLFFVFLIFFAFLFFEIKVIHADTHLTVRTGSHKTFFTRPISGNKTTFFGLKSLNKPSCKVKNQLTFCKVNYFKYYFYDTAYSQCFKISYGLTTIFLHTYLKKREQTEKDFEFSMLNLNDFS